MISEELMAWMREPRLRSVARRRRGTRTRGAHGAASAAPRPAARVHLLAAEARSVAGRIGAVGGGLVSPVTTSRYGWLAREPSEAVLRRA